MDIRSLVKFSGERGLLGMAFHPNYASNGLFFVHYSGLSGETVLTRYSVSANPDFADPSSALVFLTESQPATNHNGGMISFREELGLTEQNDPRRRQPEPAPQRAALDLHSAAAEREFVGLTQPFEP